MKKYLVLLICLVIGTALVLAACGDVSTSNLASDKSLSGTSALRVAGSEANATYMLIQGDFSRPVEPLVLGRSAAAFYKYNIGNYASANTGLEVSNASLFFLYESIDEDRQSLIMIHDKERDGGGGKAIFKFEGLPTVSFWEVMDDPGEYATLSEARWHWDRCCTDGGAISSIDGFSEIRITPTFTKYQDKIDEWVFLSGDINDPTYITLPSLTETAIIRPIKDIPVALDIKPTSCPNPVNTKSNGVVPVAILGSDEIDVTQIDLDSIRLAGLAPIRSDLEDVATPYEPLTGKETTLDCTEEGPDGYLDLTLKFAPQDLLEAVTLYFGAELIDGEAYVLPVTGNILTEDGSIPLVGEDVVKILKKGKK